MLPTLLFDKAQARKQSVHTSKYKHSYTSILTNKLSSWMDFLLKESLKGLFLGFLDVHRRCRREDWILLFHGRWNGWDCFRAIEKYSNRGWHLEIQPFNESKVQERQQQMGHRGVCLAQRKKRPPPKIEKLLLEAAKETLESLNQSDHLLQVLKKKMNVARGAGIWG